MQIVLPLWSVLHPDSTCVGGCHTAAGDRSIVHILHTKRRQQAEAEGKQQWRDREADREENNCRRREGKEKTQRKQVDRCRNRNSDRVTEIIASLSNYQLSEGEHRKRQQSIDIECEWAVENEKEKCEEKNCRKMQCRDIPADKHLHKNMQLFSLDLVNLHKERIPQICWNFWHSQTKWQKVTMIENQNRCITYTINFEMVAYIFDFWKKGIRRWNW